MADDNYLTLAEVAKQLPASRGRRVHTNTVRRWASQGVRGIVLETVIVGGRRYTTEAALETFSRRLTAKRDGR